MVSLAQLVRASDCGSEGRGFEPHTSPQGLLEDSKNFESSFLYPPPINKKTHIYQKIRLL